MEQKINSMTDETQKKIKKIITDKMESLIHRRVVDEPFNKKEVKVKNPFGYRLAPIEVWKGSKFERSFVTVLGQGIFEQIAEALAMNNGDCAKGQYNYTFNIDKNKKSFIDDLINEQLTECLEIKDIQKEIKKLSEQKKELNGRNGKIKILNKEIKKQGKNVAKEKIDELELLKAQLQKINKKIQELNNKKQQVSNSFIKTTWDETIQSLKNIEPSHKTTKIKGTFDLYIKRKDTKVEEFYSLKTVKPNLDQTEIAKRNMLYVKEAVEKGVREVYFALPYNPAGEGNPYSLAKHKIPYKLFQMDSDNCVIIGSNFWNKVAGYENAYEDILKIFEEVGLKIKDRIVKEYFNNK